MTGPAQSWRQREATLWHIWAAFAVLAAAGAFYLPALRRTGGVWPAPLDDVYIYFGFARSTALGAPLSWFPGNGYSSGATAVLYPLLLAPLWALGLRGSNLGIGAAWLAAACLFDLCRSLRRLLDGSPLSWLVPPLVLSVPLLDWSLFSGMETALFAALLGRGLAASQAALEAAPERRAQQQWRAGAWLALVALTRPEALPLAIATAVAITHGARSLGTLSSLTRSLGPTALALSAEGLCNHIFTGEWAPAGAVRKLLTSNPYSDSATIALAALTNAVVLIHQGVLRALGGWPLAGIPLLLALWAIVAPGRRRLAIALLVGAGGSLVLVSLNETARYQNYRYASPTLLMLLCGAALGGWALARRRTLRPLAWMAVGAAALAPAHELGGQIRHFAQASANILEQHGQVARRLAARDPRPRRVLLGDAGAIPYLSELPPLDGLGLGGFRGLPFARASVHGLPAVVELIERLPSRERPDMMALYPGWWGGVADVFGHRVDSVTIVGNVICAADEKVIYEADWSTLGRPLERRAGAIDSVDIADLGSERDHDYGFDHPGSGWVVAATLTDEEGSARWDAGRIISAGQQQSFRVASGVERGPATLVARSDTRVDAVRVVVQGAGQHFEGWLEPSDQSQGWREPHLTLAEVAGGDRVSLRTEEGSFRAFQLWLVRP